jgi:hypothetical protein
VNRQQMSWRAVDVERLIGEDHAARAIWTLVGRLDLNPFYRAVESSEDEAVKKPSEFHSDVWGTRGAGKGPSGRA